MSDIFFSETVYTFEPVKIVKEKSVVSETGWPDLHSAPDLIGMGRCGGGKPLRESSWACQLGPVKHQLRWGEDVVPLSNLPHSETWEIQEKFKGIIDKNENEAKGENSLSVHTCVDIRCFLSTADQQAWGENNNIQIS